MGLYICVCLTSKSERYSKRTSLSNDLSTTLGQTLANLLRFHLGTSNCIIYSKGEKSLCSSQKVSCLRTECRHGKWPNQYKLSLHFSLPLSQLFYYNQFCLACLKNIIKLIVVSTSAF